MRIANQECEACGGQIGDDEFVLCHDGVTAKIVAFHKRCNPSDPDLKREFGVTLNPAKFGLTGEGLG